jgi:hypothetical protein
VSAILGDSLRVEFTAGTNCRLLLTAPWGRTFAFPFLGFRYICASWSRIIARYHIHNIHKNIPITQLFQFMRFIQCTIRLPLLAVACSLATVECAAVAVQLCPHAYPDGQHPPPAVSEHLNHPLAHFPVVLELDPVATGSTIVKPFEINVVDEVVGHDVVSQFRPVWQHPPWYTAEQA